MEFFFKHMFIFVYILSFAKAETLRSTTNYIDILDEKLNQLTKLNNMLTNKLNTLETRTSDLESIAAALTKKNSMMHEKLSQMDKKIEARDAIIKDLRKTNHFLDKTIKRERQEVDDNPPLNLLKGKTNQLEKGMVINQTDQAAPILRKSEYKEEIVKCLRAESEKFQISCPRGHVIYNPSILAGISQTGSCMHKPGDCLGKSAYIQHQLDSCHFNNKCDIKLCRKDEIRCKSDFKGKLGHIDYFIIQQPYCIPNGLIIDICSDKHRHRKFNFETGVIRSDKRYPRPLFRDKFRTCDVTIPVQESQTLVTRAFRGNKQKKFQKNYRVMAISRYPSEKPYDITQNMTDKLILAGDQLQAIRVVATLGPRRRDREGFIVPFSLFRTDSLKAIRRWPKGSFDVLKTLDWIFEVRAVINQCIGNCKGEVILQCKPDEVIFSLGMSVSGYTRDRPKCMFGRFPCGGLTSDILVQRNSCYWKNSCAVKWDGERKIILSRKRSCIGYVASNLGISSNRCVKEKAIYDLCSRDIETIRASWGVIRSHAQYPWYFDTGFSDCKRIIKIGKGQTLLLIIQDINLDPDGRDKFYVKHVTKDGRQEVMNAKTAREGAHLQVKGGRLVIRFKPFAHSKTGRGFVFIFRREKMTMQKRDVEDRGIPSTSNGDVAVNDWPVGMKYKLTNQRLCSGMQMERKRGRSCHARVWTDYFTRID